MTKAFFNPVLETAVIAGKAIMDVYENDDFGVEMKDDNSPLTKADKKAHNIIVQALKNTNIPVLSEESEDKDWEKRRHWKTFWLVDPLDGTKEFIKRNGDFTVNIALIENGLSVAGIIYVPVTRELFFGHREHAAYKIKVDDCQKDLYDCLLDTEPIRVDTLVKKQVVIVGSRSHMNTETSDFIASMSEKYEVEMLSRGSSLKICMIAEGKAQLYPRFAPTMEWDTAAGHAIAVSAGAEIINWETQKELEYNKQNLRNPWFMVRPKKIEF